ncbi:uncharacterized protein LOC133734191 isoform X1 [Rosa rugosa]|uniref:uncharacterized protein LOC133734191 isoform X1 n=1 Tax=Rosa rugosa TaxID=74645 RepID=UPI002B415739|nr:uncharacterized protein LOC133734191 isoform X1 [Rosa rugosa]
MSQLSSLSFRPYYGSLSFSVNRTPSFCRFNLPFRCPTTSGLRGNSLTGALSPDMCQLTGLWYFDVRGNNLTGPASRIRSPKSIFTRMVGMERLGVSFVRKVHDPSIDCWNYRKRAKSSYRSF